MQYKIIRYFRDRPRSVSIAYSLTRDEARAWCKDPETHSETCTTKTGKARTRKYGPWFDAFTAQK